MVEVRSVGALSVQALDWGDLVACNNFYRSLQTEVVAMFVLCTSLFVVYYY